MVVSLPHWTKPPAEILQISKEVDAEVLGLLEREKTIYLRVCWQDGAFDGLARFLLPSEKYGKHILGL